MRAIPTIWRDSGTYRRGMVLGLTMAEIMLLLVFCLLIAMATIVENSQAEQKKLTGQVADQSARIAELLDAQRRLQDLLDAFKRSPDAPAITDDWTKLVEASQSVDRLKDADLPIEELLADPAKIRALLDIAKNGTDLKQLVDARAFQQKLEKALVDLKILDRDPERLAKLIAAGQATSDRKGEHDWPPIINLSEAAGYNFPTGRADLSSDFTKKLTSTVVDRVASIVKSYDVDIVEVIGHTDEQPMAGRSSNLDAALVKAFRTGAAIKPER